MAKAMVFVGQDTTRKRKERRFGLDGERESFLPAQMLEQKVKDAKRVDHVLLNTNIYFEARRQPSVGGLSR
jgi:hypothetical protein